MALPWPLPPGAGDLAWERSWAPYDPPTYRAVLDLIRPEDVVLEIGAGDLRLAKLIARAARRVYAIEMQPALLEQAASPGQAPLPGGLQVICADALAFPFPPGITTAVLLMRHCTHFRFYAEKLRAAGCERLITNARWKMGVEQVHLSAPRLAYRDVKMGWYACWCGSASFKPGQPDEFTEELDRITHEVSDCPVCRAEKPAKN